MSICLHCHVNLLVWDTEDLLSKNCLYFQQGLLIACIFSFNSQARTTKFTKINLGTNRTYNAKLNIHHIYPFLSILLFFLSFFLPQFILVWKSIGDVIAPQTSSSMFQQNSEFNVSTKHLRSLYFHLETQLKLKNVQRTPLSIVSNYPIVRVYLSFCDCGVNSECGEV